MLTNPLIRLAGRALFVGVLATLGSLQTTTDTNVRSVVTGAILAGCLAAFEVLTPFNQTVGVGKEKP